VNLYSGNAATENSFRSRSSKGDYILHLSTHGFFQEDHANMSLTNPMYNSGLFMAGADSTWVNNLPHSPNDGILRSDEIQYMDFNGCHLAVLSACETGIGYNENSEGVYGLQRAFKLAGVNKILMSLWKVSDYHTSELMKKLYEGIGAGKNVEDALKDAQGAIREENSSPLYWGGFVLLD
jgi:CHAT domain-containing protein